MSNEVPTAKCSCRHCDQYIEFPLEMAGQTVACPNCQRETVLVKPKSTIELSFPSNEHLWARALEQVFAEQGHKISITMKPKASEEETGAVQVAPANKNPGVKPNPEALLVAQNEFLARLDNGAIGSWVETWTALLGKPLEDCLSDYIAAGLIEKAPLAKKFECKYGVAELKPLLRSAGTKVSGTKVAMVQNLIAAISGEEAAKLVADVRLYQATPKGQQRIRDFQAKQQRERERMESDVLAAILRGKLDEARQIITCYGSRQRFPNDYNCHFADDARILADDPCSALCLHDAQRRTVAAAMALSALLGENSAKCANRVLKVTGESFPCPSLEQFARENPHGIAARIFNSEDLTQLEAMELALTYVQTRFSRARQSVQLQQLKESSADGVTIIAGECQPPCKICGAGKSVFPFSAGQAIPKLPLHWGCNCWYAAWFDPESAGSFGAH
jgi:DNA-directed RNA polymerase subunit RPC12/RpoP